MGQNPHHKLSKGYGRPRLTCPLSGNTTATATTPRAEHRAVLPVSEPRLWAGSQTCTTTLELLVNGEVVDSVKTYFGMRKVEACNKIYLNNEPITSVWCDQGFCQMIYTPVRLMRSKDDLIKAAGFNGVQASENRGSPSTITALKLTLGLGKNAYVQLRRTMWPTCGRVAASSAAAVQLPSIMAWVP